MPRRHAVPSLDLIPVMNLVTILIPFLLFSASFASLAAIDSTLPAITPRLVPPPPAPSLQLVVEVTPAGYRLTAALPLTSSEDPILVERGRTESAWPTSELTAALSDVKQRYPKADTVILQPSPTIPYEVVVQTMDAARGERQELFPAVVMAGGES